MPLTMPLRMRPAPRAASQPSTTLTQLVPLSVLLAFTEPRSDSRSLRASSTRRGPVSFSSTRGALVLPSLSVICLLLPRSLVCPCFLLCRGLGLGHEAVVDQRAKSPADDRPKYVEPDAREVTGHDHRAEGARRVDRPPRHRAGDEDTDREGEPDGDGRYGGWR